MLDLALPGAREDRLGIVIVTRNRAERLLATLATLRALEAPYPIVVVDNGSDDGTPAQVATRFPEIEVVALPHNLGGGARNRGVQRLRREFIAFADDDSWWQVGALARAIELFDAHPTLGLVMSRVLAGPEERLDPCCAEMAHSPLPPDGAAPGMPILGFLACGVVFRRAAFLARGGFQERFRTGGEEAVVAWDIARDGWQLRYVPEIVSHHHPAPRDNMRERYIEGYCADIWLACLRRRPGRIASVALGQLRRAASQRDYRTAIGRAWPQVPRVLRERDPLPRWLERQVELLERGQR